MRRSSLLIAGLCTACLLAGPARSQDFLGKDAAHWQGQLASKDAATRRSAAFALGKIGPPAATAAEPLLACLTADTDRSVREAVAHSLGQLWPRGQAPARIVTALCAHLTDANEDAQVRRSCAVALGTCAADTVEVRAALEQAVAAKDAAVRQNAAWALGEVCQKSAEVPLAALRRALADDDKLVKRDAALALGKIVSHPATQDKTVKQVREAMPELLACARHPYLELRKAACAALALVVGPGDAEATALLVQLCRDKGEDIEVRRNAALALARACDDKTRKELGPVAAEVLHGALRTGDLETKRLAALAFWNIGEPGAAALADLLAAVKSSDPQLRYNAVVGVSGLRTRAYPAVPELVSLLANRKEPTDLRTAAARALQVIGRCQEATDAVPALVKVLNDRSDSRRVRERVLWALRVHNADKMAQMPDVLDALTKVLTEPGLPDTKAGPGESGKMLRYDAAYLLCRVKKTEVPEEVFSVLLDFLHDSSIRIYLGLGTKVGPISEPGGGSGTTAEKTGIDGRIMAVQALSQVGPERVRAQPKIVQQLRALRDNANIEMELRDAARDLLKTLE